MDSTETLSTFRPVAPAQVANTCRLSTHVTATTVRRSGDCGAQTSENENEKVSTVPSTLWVYLWRINIFSSKDCECQYCIGKTPLVINYPCTIAVNNGRFIPLHRVIGLQLSLKQTDGYHICDGSFVSSVHESPTEKLNLVRLHAAS